ncbi:MAG: 3'-5' exonuclease [Cytophagales bacterium]|nr:3'-5' exonuclease [Cytophagales bacterium]
MPRIPSPSKDAIALLPEFPRLTLAHITVVSHANQALQAYESLQGLSVVGFDTESKPTFIANEISTGPHVVQFATPDSAYVFQLRDATCRAIVCQLLMSTTVLKVGFGLAGDGTQIRRTLGIEPLNVLDINTLFKAKGYVKELGVKSAVAVMFNQRFVKSRKATTSNWANQVLSEGQIIYAANDAWAALKVYETLI